MIRNLAIRFILLMVTGPAGAQPASTIRPLMVGMEIPNLLVRTPDGKEQHLGDVLNGKFTMLGCTAALTTEQTATRRYIAGIKPFMQKLGYQVVVLSGSSVEALHSMADHFADTILFSDEKRVALNAFGLTEGLTSPVNTAIFLVGPDRHILFEFSSVGNSVPVSGEVLVLAARVYRDLTVRQQASKKPPL